MTKIIFMIIKIGLIIGGCVLIGIGIDRESISYFWSGLGCIGALFYLDENVE